MPLRVCIAPHIPLSLAFGGLEVQQEQTVLALVNNGIEVQRFDPWNKTFDSDILHVFGSFHHQAETVFRAKAKSIPVVVTSMFVRTRSPLAYSIAGVVDKLGLRTIFSLRREMLHACSRIIALSEIEKHDLVKVFGVSESKVDVIGNGVEPQFFHTSPEIFRSKYGDHDFILCVASVEPNKNQLSLINAIGPTGIPLVIIGNAKLYHTDVMRQYIDDVEHACEKYANVHWIKGLDHDDPMLQSAYAAARVHVLASHAEAQGISSMEAAASGCTIAMSDLPTLTSTFGTDALYFDPTSVESIRATLITAWNTHRGGALTNHLGVRPSWLLSWSDVATLLKHSYERCLGVTTS